MASLITGMKYRRQGWLGAALGELLAEIVTPIPSPVAVVPVPIHRRRLIERGFNQALEIALPVARRLGCRPRDAAVRLRDTPPQTRLRATHRRLNLEACFRWRGSAPARVLIVDDVITTGSTVNSLALTARRAGAEWVAAVAVARAG